MINGIGVFGILHSTFEYDEIVLVRHNYGQRGWSLPGGGLEPYESIIEGLMREIKEETGFTNIRVVKQVGIFSSRLGNNPVILFECEFIDKENRAPYDESEIKECCTFNLRSLPKGLYMAQRRLIDIWRGVIMFKKYDGQIYDWLSEEKI